LGISDLFQRVSALMMDPVVVRDDGLAVPSPDLGPLRAEIAALLAESSEDPALRELTAMLDMLDAAFSNPVVAKSMAEMAAAMREHGPNPDIFDAVDAGDLEEIRAALALWDVNQTFGQYGSTALYRAMSGSNSVSLEVIDLLLDAGADSRKGLTHTNVLHGLGFANLRGVAPAELAERVRRCVELGADLEERTERLRWTPLIGAASEWNPVAVEALLLAGADITARAGEVEGVCFSGADCMTFATGHDATVAVLARYARPN